MAAMTYATLQTDISATISRDDLTTRIDNWIEQAEFRLARDIFPRGHRAYASSTFTATEAGAVIDLPTRFISAISFHALADSAGTATGSYFYPVLWRTLSFVRAYNPLQSTSGRPKYWTGLDENQALVAPSPSVAFAFRLAYFERLAPLSDSNTTNWWTANHPDVLLYACLLESAPYLRDDERVPTWKIEYQERSAALAAVEKNFTADVASGAGPLGGEVK